MSRRIVIADDHFLIRSGLRILLESEPDLEVIGEAGNGCELLEILATRTCDLVILDLSMPALNGLETLERIQSEFPRVHVLVLTVHKNQQTIAQALNRGARGYVIKEEQEAIILGAVRKVLSGDIAISTGFSAAASQTALATDPGETDRHDSTLALLSGREREVLLCVAQGHTSKRIGAELGISHTTVNKHVEHIKQKLGIHRKAGLIRFAVSRGLQGRFTQ